MKKLVKALTLAFSLLIAPLAIQALAQNTTTTTQSSPAAQSTSQTTRETTTTTQTSRPTQTNTTQSTTGVDPLWLIIGGIALLAILLIVVLSMRGRSRDGGDTVYEKKTTIKRE